MTSKVYIGYFPFHGDRSHPCGPYLIIKVFGNDVKIAWLYFAALIREVLDDVRWDQMTPYAGAPRLAIALARYCIFGTKVLMESSVTGRNSKNPLNNLAMKKIKGERMS